MMAIRRKLPKQFEEPPASAVDHLDEIPRRAERVHKRKATLPDYWWHVEYVAGTSALPADEKVTGLLRTRELLRTQMEEDGNQEDDRQKSAVKNLVARIKTRLESARKAKKTEAERSAGGHPVQPPGGVRKDTPRAAGGRSGAAQRAAHSVSKHRVTSPTEWTAGTGPGEAHRAAENDFGPAPKRAKPVRDTCTRGWWMARAGVGAGMRPGIDVMWHARAWILSGVDVVVDGMRGRG
eukprot:jgi/Mesvir1/13209/Mv06168-RA.1